MFTGIGSNSLIVVIHVLVWYVKISVGDAMSILLGVQWRVLSIR
jgi:hypothetical protein